ncbi:metal-dependent transcriptional regulator [Anaerococcus sp. NML200574]|uniref:metal-dependent transcriptional regulator n=1 Tax=Anaerococcus sp. NML200574 TaxID=2954486 RepID=UPI002238EB0C|nr:metal-dependent transcriptional regulator [Anaerococcus sp. NML200574]MCW6678410.1 metal-dependent transcriptional regulator [Anaerococcus sp. NML200574]
MEKINPQREDYLTIIYKLMQENDKITNKDISQALDISPPSVTEMLKKLKTEGLIKDDKTNFLTDKGVSLARLLISKHRLWEYFLQETLDYSWKDVHEIANKLQSATPDDLLDKLNDFLGHPKYCPHGSVIYINNEGTGRDLVRMSEAKAGATYTIRRIRDERSLLNYAESMGIDIGDRVKIVKFDPFDMTAIIEKDGIEKRISPKACVDIYLLEEDDGDK